MILELIESAAAILLVLFLIGVLLYQTRKAILNEKKVTPWQRAEAEVLTAEPGARVSFRYQEWILTLRYHANRQAYVVTGKIALTRGEKPPTSIEVVYMPEAPADWRFGEDYPAVEQMLPSTRVAIAWIWVLLLIVGGSVVAALFIAKRG